MGGKKFGFLYCGLTIELTICFCPRNEERRQTAASWAWRPHAGRPQWSTLHGSVLICLDTWLGILSQRWVNAGPTSQTLAQHSPIVVRVSGSAKIPLCHRDRHTDQGIYARPIGGAGLAAGHLVRFVRARRLWRHHGGCPCHVRVTFVSGWSSDCFVNVTP